MPSKAGPHTGIFREENLVVRHIFGYGGQKVDAYPLPRIGLSIPGSSIRDVLLVAVDVDTGDKYEVISPGQSFHVGVSMFDTRCLTHSSSINPDTAITTYQFINQDSKPCRLASKRYLLGPTETHTTDAMASRVRTLIQDRSYILVAHGTSQEVKFLDNIDPAIVSRACYILDTNKVAQYVLQLYYRYSLEKLLDALSIPGSPCSRHAAGNDAYFALKALLGLAARDMAAEMHASTPGIRESIETHILRLQDIARVPYPPWPENPPKMHKLSRKDKKERRRLEEKERQERNAIRREFAALAHLPCVYQEPSQGPHGHKADEY